MFGGVTYVHSDNICGGGGASTSGLDCAPDKMSF